MAYTRIVSVSRCSHDANASIKAFAKDLRKAIEIDGPIHLYTEDYDNEKDEYLKNTGLTILRFSNEDIKSRVDWVLGEIKSFSPPGETGKGVK